jgi:two-component sensor histidine kinase
MSLSQVIPIRPNTRIEFALIHEANHRVANHLAVLAGLVQVQASNVAKGPSQFTREEVHGMLREVAGKVIGVGQLHRRLSDRPQEEIIDLGDYLIESSHSLVKTLALEGRIGVVHRLDAKCPAKAEQVQPVALIVGEVIMNAIKHAHPTGIPVEISIRCGRDAAGRTIVEIEDDGIGLPEGFNPNSDGGTGLRLIRMLASSLRADLKIESDSLGTRFVVALPPATDTA